MVEPACRRFRGRFSGVARRRPIIKLLSVKIGNFLTASLAPIRNPVTQEPESIRVHQATGVMFQDAECASAEEMRVSAGELNFSWPKKAAFVTRVKYGN